MLTKVNFSILPNRSQAQKEAKTRTFLHSNYKQTLEPCGKVAQNMKVARSKPVLPGVPQLLGKEAEAGADPGWRKPFPWVF